MDSDELAVTVDARIRVDIEVDHEHDSRQVPMIQIDHETEDGDSLGPDNVGARAFYRCPECSTVVSVRALANSNADPRLGIERGR